MKKLVFLIAALAIVGCTKQGGTEDRYDSTTGRSGTTTPERTPSATTNLNSSSTNTPSLPQ